MYTVSQNFTLLGIAYIPLARLFTASLSLYAKGKASAKHPGQVSRFALASCSLAMLSMHSTIEQKYRKKEGCEQSRL